MHGFGNTGSNAEFEVHDDLLGRARTTAILVQRLLDDRRLHGRRLLHDPQLAEIHAVADQRLGGDGEGHRLATSDRQPAQRIGHRTSSKLAFEAMAGAACHARHWTGAMMGRCRIP